MEDLRQARARAEAAKAEAKKATEDFHALVWEAQGEGINLSAVAREFDVSRQAVYEWISKAVPRAPDWR